MISCVKGLMNGNLNDMFSSRMVMVFSLAMRHLSVISILSLWPCELTVAIRFKHMNWM